MTALLPSSERTSDDAAAPDLPATPTAGAGRLPSDGPVARACGTFSELVRCLHRLDPLDWIDLDLTMSQLKTIVMVVEAGGLTGRDLAERLGIGPPAVTALVDRLVQRGYVRREEDRADRRLSWARPTERAVALFERLHASHRERLVEILTTLPPEEIDLVERALVILHAAAARRVAERRAAGNGA